MIIFKSDYNEEEQRDVKNKSHFQAVGPTDLDLEMILYDGHFTLFHFILSTIQLSFLKMRKLSIRLLK